MRAARLAAGVVALTLFSAPSAHACTTFCFADALVFGKNYDWGISNGLVLVNKRGVEKRAFVEQNPFAWTSRFGSVTFNQYGREFPCGGINEKGLVVELMWLDDSEYPAPDARGALPTLQWIQYQLDTAADVAQVIASDAVVRITGAHAKIHFLVADAGGETAAIEFLAGKMVAQRGARALTNDTYQRSAAYARTFNDVTRELSHSSLDRFAIAAARVAGGPGAETAPVTAAFDLLARVAQGEYTQWSIVYDIGGRRVHFRTQANPIARSIDIAKLDFACATPVRMIDVNTPLTGDATARLTDYSEDANRVLVRASFAGTDFLRALPPETADAQARFPASTRCAR